MKDVGQDESFRRPDDSPAGPVVPTNIGDTPPGMAKIARRRVTTLW